MQVLVFNKDGSEVVGLPTTDLLADVTDRVSDLTFTTAATWGPLEARITMTGTFDEGYEIADRWLGCPVEIWSPDGEWCWEGLIWTVRFGTGRRRRSRSLEGYATWGSFFYDRINTNGTPYDGPPQYVVAGDHQLQGEYPGIVYNMTGPMALVYAERQAASLIAARQRLLWLPESSGGYPDEAAEPTIEIECLGWYRTLWYSQYARYTNEFLDIADVLRDMLLHYGYMPYIAQDDSQIMATTWDAMYNRFDQFEATGEIIKKLAQRAVGPYAGVKEVIFGLQQGRVPYLRESKRYSTTADYLEHLDGTITDASGGAVPPYLIKPDTILRQVDFAPASLSSGVAIDSIESIYISEVTYTSSDNSLSYKTAVPGVLGEVSE